MIIGDQSEGINDVSAVDDRDMAEAEVLEEVIEFVCAVIAVVGRLRTFLLKNIACLSRVIYLRA